MVECSFLVVCRIGHLGLQTWTAGVLSEEHTKVLVHQQEVDTWDALFHCILDTAASIKANQSDLCTSFTNEPWCVLKKTVVIFEQLLWTQQWKFYENTCLRVFLNILVEQSITVVSGLCYMTFVTENGLRYKVTKLQHLAVIILCVFVFVPAHAYVCAHACTYNV
jgi:hypothetical protein